MENTIDQITLGFSLGFDLLVLCTSFQNQSQSKVMRNQSNCELLSTIKWKLLKYSLWELYTVYFTISKKKGKFKKPSPAKKTWVKLALKSQNIRLCLATSSPPKIIFVGRRQLWPGYQWTKYRLLILKKTKQNHYLGYEIVMLLSMQEL